MQKNKIGLSGKFVSGKTTVANQFVVKHDYKRIAIADNIKWVCNRLIEDYERGVLYEKPENNEVLTNFFRNSVQLGSNETNKTIKRLSEAMVDFCTSNERNWVKNAEGYKKNDDYRELTQLHGTIIRDMYGSDVWVNWYLQIADNYNRKEIPVICDDVRLEPEKTALEENDFLVVRLDVSEEVQNKRHLELYGKEPDEKRKKHITETDLDDSEFTLRIDNSNKTVNETFTIVEKAGISHERIAFS